MIRNIEMFQTSDGKCFENAAKAEEHVANAIREALDARLHGMMVAGKLPASDRYWIIMALIPDAEAAKTLHQQMSRWLDY